MVSNEGSRSLSEATNRLDLCIAKEQYDSLKKQVSLLKEDHRKNLSARQAARKLEELTLLQQSEEFQTREAEYQARISSLQRNLKEVTERSSRVRAQYEKEKKVLSVRADKLAKRVEELHEQQNASASELVRRHEGELAQLRTQLRDQVHEQEHEREEALQREKDIETRAAEWCEREVQKVTQENKARLVEVMGSEQAWRDQCVRVQESLEQAQSRAAQSDNRCAEYEERCAELEGVVRGLEQRLQTATEAQLATAVRRDQEREDSSRQLQELELKHQAEMEEYRERKAAEMDALGVRFRTIVDRKDAALAELRERLSLAQSQAAHYEQVLQRQREEFLGPEPEP